MQAIHNDVTVFVTLRELQSRAPKPDGSIAVTTALQYVAENAGFDTVTFRVDFSESANIKLHRPASAPRCGENTANTLQKSTQEMVFECELHPLERRVLAFVVKKAKKRAFVRVHYSVAAVTTPSIDAVVEAQQVTATKLQQLLQRSNNTFRHISKWKALPCQSGAAIDRACAEINRYFRDFGEVFVDSSFPPTTESLYALEIPNKLPEGDSAVYTLCSWKHLHKLAGSSWTFVAPGKTRLQAPIPEAATTSSFTSGLPSQDSFICALSIIAPYRELWFRRWFPSLDSASEVENMSVISVALCNEGVSWQTVLIDLFLPRFPLGDGLMAPRNVEGELYAAILHKAYAKLKYSYAAISDIPTIDILRELTGNPWVCCYDSSCEYDIDQRSEQLQHAVEATLSRQRRAKISPDFDLTSNLVTATLGKIDNHRRAFRVSVLDDGGARIVLHDDSGKYLHKRFFDNLAEFNRDQDPTSLCLSWDQLDALEPVMWSLALRRQHERRLRQVYLHESGAVQMTIAISVPVLATVAFSCFYSPHLSSESSGVEGQDPGPNVQLSIAAVENDFSLTPLEGHSMELAATVHQSRGGVFRNQEVRTLSAGEYVVTISAERQGRTESQEGEPVSDKAPLTPASVDANLQLAFDCLDREGRHELSEDDIVSFLELHERVLPTQHGKEALRSLLLQYGSSASPGSLERRLTLDDFREIYLGLSARDCTEPLATSESVRTRLRELVWQDLLRLISNSDGAEINSRIAISCSDIVQLACCFHSDVPLLDATVLPDETRAFSGTSFNMQM